MKFKLSALIVGISIFMVTNQGFAQNNGTPGSLPSPVVIDQFDSAFFDISQAVINGSTVEFPVMLRSDDVINALDFAFKYDQTHLLYDTIINLTNYIEPLAYYNPNDSTVRLTSYSFTQPYTNDTPLVSVRFTMLSGILCAVDIDSLSALLNGDASSYLITDCTTGLEEDIQVSAVNIYPNPATDFINVETSGCEKLEIVDAKSQVVYYCGKELKQNARIDVSKFPAGNYIIRISGIKILQIGKFVIIR